jgi:hypothetical protein
MFADESRGEVNVASQVLVLESCNWLAFALPPSQLRGQDMQHEAPRCHAEKKNGTSHRIKNGLFLTGVLGFRERFFC